MQKPYVESLRYRLDIKGGSDYSSVEPLEHATDRFTLKLDDHMLTAIPVDRYRTVATARGALEPALRAYEIHASLQRGPEEFRFQFEDAKVRPAPSDKDDVVEVNVSIQQARQGVRAKLQVVRQAYPAFPDDFKLSPEVETLWTRWRSYRQGREKLLPMAYFCLTVLEYRAKIKYDKGSTRNNAAKQFNISYRVLCTLGKLTTKRGDVGSARKKRVDLEELRQIEKEWILACIPKLIDHVAHPAPDKLIMDDLPSLG